MGTSTMEANRVLQPKKGHEEQLDRDALVEYAMYYCSNGENVERAVGPKQEDMY